MKRQAWNVVAGLVVCAALVTGAGMDANRPNEAGEGDGAMELAEARATFEQAEALRKEGSYHRAAELYERVLAAVPEDAGDEPAELRRWSRVWLADVTWRERRRDDPEGSARKALGRLVEDLPQGSRARAEAAQSLAEVIAENPWIYYRHDPPPDEDPRAEMIEAWLIAIEYWGQATEDLDTSRRRYLELNFTLAEAVINQGMFDLELSAAARKLNLALPPPAPPEKPWLNDLATWALTNVLRVAEDNDDRGRALTMLGRIHSQHRFAETDKDEAERYYRQAIELDPRHEWTDDALIELAYFYENEKRYRDAVRTLDHLLKAYRKGTTPYRDDAQRRRLAITGPTAGIRGDEALAPGSVIRLDMNWRNVDRIELEVRKLPAKELLRYPEIKAKGRVVRTWVVEGVEDRGDYEPHSRRQFLEPLEERGLYVLRLTATGKRLAGRKPLHDEHVFMVTRLALAAKNTPDEATTGLTVFAVDAETGEPVADASVHAVRRLQPRTSARRELTHETRTGEDGLAHIEWGHAAAAGRYTLVAESPAGDVARIEGWLSGSRGMEEDIGRPVLHVFADRPAYRPEEPIHWKAILRFTQGKEYRLPQAAACKVEIRDGRGQMAYEGTHEVDEYGTLHGTFEVGREAALGMMVLQLKEANKDQHIASAQLCRLEEYKLPEFAVTVEPAQGQFSFGAARPVDLRAEYYFGGPVAEAEVEVLIKRAPYWRSWSPWVPYPWLYLDRPHPGFHMPWSHSQPELIEKLDLKTDAEGRVTFEIPALSEARLREAKSADYWGYEYTIEARVVDLSRREVRDTARVRMTETTFAAYLTPQRYLYLPGDTVKIDLKTQDANDRPLAVEGRAEFFRREWDRDRQDDAGEPDPGYRDTELFTRAVTTDESGSGVIDFAPEQDGYYLVKFAARDAFGENVEAETTVWIADRRTQRVGYRSGGVEIITDKESYARGETAQVMLVLGRPGAAVWFGVEAEAVHEQRVIRPTGNVQLVPVKITEDLEPNVFLTAHAMFDWSAFSARKRLVIPPERRFLDVRVITEKAEYQPGEQAKIDIEVRDWQGEPVATDLALGVGDAAVWAIQSDLAGDIRQAFWSRVRNLRVQTESTPGAYRIMRWQPRQDGEGYDPAGHDEQPNAMFARRFTGGRDEGAMGIAGLAKATRSDGAPMPTPSPPAPMAAMELADAAEPEALANGAAAGELAEPRLRTDFRSTALWLANVRTGVDGRATAEITWPDSLTTWRATARAADRATRVGQVTHEVRTNKPIMVRPQGPRFFTEGDEAVISAVVTNNTSEAQTLVVDLEATNLDLLEPAQDGIVAALEAVTDPVAARRPDVRIVVPPHNQRRVDWRIKATRPESQPFETRIRMRVRGADEGDAAEKTYPILEYGIEKFVRSGATLTGPEGEVTQTLVLELPEARHAGRETLTVMLEPTLARTMLQCLPYLAEYPYGCIEQTVSRFIPAAIVAHTLERLELSYPKLERKLPKMMRRGLKKIYDEQKNDGGWSWWSGNERSNPWMTAYVVQALGQAREAGVEVRPDVLTRAGAFLSRALIEYEKAPDTAAFVLYARSMVQGGTRQERELVDAAHDRLWAQRHDLNPYTRALFTLACARTGRSDRLEVLGRNLENGVRDDPTNGTAHWGEGGVFYHWSDGGVESTAFVLRALLAVRPDDALVDRAMTWLVRNRHGNRWSNTRDSAFAIAALSDFVLARGEARSAWTCEVRLNGESVGSVEVTPETVFEAETSLNVPAERLLPGQNTLEIVRQGSGPVYASAWLSYFTQEERIEPAGFEVYVERRYFRIENKPTADGGYTQVRTELARNAEVRSGDRIEVVLTLEAKNHYEYVVVEDMKPAGAEPTELQSGGAAADPGAGWSYGGLGWLHREFRDERTAFFIDRLPQGKHTIRYELRAEVPGRFAGLPAQAHAMYIPEIRGNSANAWLEVKE